MSHMSGSLTVLQDSVRGRLIGRVIGATRRVKDKFQYIAGPSPSRAPTSISTCSTLGANGHGNLLFRGSTTLVCDELLGRQARPGALVLEA